MDYELIRSRRRTVSLSISPRLTPVVRAPMHMPKRELDAFIQQHLDWIAEKTALLAQQQQRPCLTDGQIATLRTRAKQELPQRVQRLAQQMELTPAGITITSAQSRWGSCSAKNRLSFPYRLMLLPDDLIEYIIVHELAHIREKNHSPRFYAVVAAYLPDYKARVTRLKQLQPELPR
ncbi:MAG: SprT family zinc-dependent metalloprotease [Angelakisella sp.]